MPKDKEKSKGSIYIVYVYAYFPTLSSSSLFGRLLLLYFIDELITSLHIHIKDPFLLHQGKLIMILLRRPFLFFKRLISLSLYIYIYAQLQRKWFSFKVLCLVSHPLEKISSSSSNLGYGGDAAVPATVEALDPPRRSRLVPKLHPAPSPAVLPGGGGRRWGRRGRWKSH